MNVAVPETKIPDHYPLWIKQLRDMLSACADVPKVDMTLAEKAAFQQEYFHPTFGPCLARIGSFVIYFDSDDPRQMRGQPVCPNCEHEIEPDVCWCGDSKLNHTMDHNFVPMGCTCGYANQPETKPPLDSQ